MEADGSPIAEEWNGEFGSSCRTEDGRCFWWRMTADPMAEGPDYGEWVEYLQA